MSKKKQRLYFDEPNMSDYSILVKVEDLISIAMGPPDKNTINFKLLQSILHILARQMRMLQQNVEIRISQVQNERSGSIESEIPTKETQSPRSAARKEIKPNVGPGETKWTERDSSRTRDEERARQVDGNQDRDDTPRKESRKEKSKNQQDREESAEGKERGEKSPRKEKDKNKRSEMRTRDIEEESDHLKPEKVKPKRDKRGEKYRDEINKEEYDEINTSNINDRQQKDTERRKDKSNEKDKERREGDSDGESDRDRKIRLKGVQGQSTGKEREEEHSRTDRSSSRREKDRLQDKDRSRESDRVKTKQGTGRYGKTDQIQGDVSFSESDRDQSEDRSKKIQEKSVRDRPEKDRGGDRDRPERDPANAKERDMSKKDSERLEDHRAERDAESLRSKKAKSTSRDRNGDRSDKDRDRSEKDAELLRLEKGTLSPRDEVKDRSEMQKNVSPSRENRDRPKKDAEPLRSERGKSTSRDRDDDRGKLKSREQDSESLGEGGKAEEKERGRSDKTPGKKSSATSIAISEVERQKEKVLVVDRVPYARPAGGGPTRVGSIEVVTQSQFKLLEQAIRSLEQKAAPLPPPTLPENKKLRSDIAKGSASLTDTMKAMQISARVQAAEKAISRLTELMTQLASTGALPKDLAGRAVDIKADVQSLAQDTQSLRKPEVDTSSIKKSLPSIFKGTTSATSSLAPSQAANREVRKSVQIDAQTGMPTATMSTTSRPDSVRPPGYRTGATDSPWAGPLFQKRHSATSESIPGDAVGVTSSEMDDALKLLRDDLYMFMNDTTTKSTTHADAAIQTARAVAQKLDLVLKLDSRLSSLFSVVADYSQQMNGFDAGITTQMQGFQEQINQMRNELKFGLSQLQQVNNNAETAAVKELGERYEGLVTELEGTLHGHQTIAAVQRNLSIDMKSLVECVEMLREQKADREEVLDGLRDKADMSRLSGLMTDEFFRLATADLDSRIRMCNEKFYKQGKAWMQALKDLAELVKCKARYMHLNSLKDETELQLQDLHQKIQVLTRLLGDPKAAVLTRQLAKDAACAACRVPALMCPQDPLHGVPPRLPGVRAPPVGADHEEPEEACLRQWNFEEPPEGKSHVCHRWVGGSHTLISEAVAKERALPLQAQTPGTKRYIGTGSDGRTYKLEEKLLPCVECNKLLTGKEKIPGEADDAPQPTGEGDQINVINVDDARRVTIVDEECIKRAAVLDGDKKKGGVSAGNMSTLSKSAMTFLVRSGTELVEDTPRRPGIGNIVKGRSMLVDESAVLRAAIKHDTAVSRTTVVAEELKRAVAEGTQSIPTTD